MLCPLHADYSFGALPTFLINVQEFSGGYRTNDGRSEDPEPPAARVA
jgi:hypothetical protein